MQLWRCLPMRSAHDYAANSSPGNYRCQPREPTHKKADKPGYSLLRLSHDGVPPFGAQTGANVMIDATVPASQPSSPAHASAHPSRRKAKLDVLRQWKPSVSHPAILKEVVLRSVYAQRLLGVTFFRAQIAVYQISVLLPIFTSQQDGEKFGGMLQEKLTAVRSDLRDEVARLQKIIDDNGVEVGTVAYSDQQVDTVPLYTPEANIYLGLLTTFDDVISKADVLWLSGLWRHVQRDNCIHYWRTRLVSFAREINTLQVRARGAMQRHAQLKRNNEAARTLARKHRRDAIGSEAPENTPSSGLPDLSDALAADIPSTDLPSDAEIEAGFAADAMASVDGAATASDEAVVEAKPKRTRKKAAEALAA